MNLQGIKCRLGAYHGPGAASFGYLYVDVAMLKVEVLDHEVA
jgi:hypothetical protein